MAFLAAIASLLLAWALGAVERATNTKVRALAYRIEAAQEPEISS